MLKIIEIKRSDIPQFVWDEFTTDIILEFKTFYKSEGMFGINPDYLLVLNYDKITQYYRGYVYNGNAPEFSEFGSFGLNKQKTERVW